MRHQKCMYLKNQIPKTHVHALLGSNNDCKACTVTFALGAVCDTTSTVS